MTSARADHRHEDKSRLSSAEASFLRGGGEMGECIRAYNWSATPLGPPNQWPLPLRTAVRILLTTNHPVFLFWGRELHCFYNDAYRRSLGPEKHPGMLGATGREAWAEIWDIIGSQIDYVMSGQGSTWHENHLVPITRHGKREDVYWTYSYSPIDDPEASHGVGGVLVLCTETTEQVFAAERLRAAESRWRQLFDQAPGFMCVLSGPQHVVEFANPTYFRVVGREDILGMPVGEALPWTVDQGYLVLLDRVYASGQPFSAREAPIVVPGHSDEPAAVRYVDFVYQPIRDERGQVNGVFVLGSDVTERKQAEEALRHSEERLRQITDALPALIAYVDSEHRYRFNNRAYTAWFGYEPTALYGMHIADVAGAEAYEAARPSIDAVLSGQPVSFERTMNYKDGGARYVKVNFIPDVDTQGNVRGFYSMISDLSERQRIEQMVRGSEEALRHADRRKDEFLATLAHELRNPLAPLRNALTALRLTRNPEALVDARAMMERQLEHLIRLVDDLLDVSRITTGRMELRTERVSISSVLESAIETSHPLIEASGHALEVNLPREAVFVDADATRLCQVFANILNNAAKYTPHAGHISLSARREGDNVVVTIEDDGVGIPPEMLPRVFELFTQVDRSLERTQGGLGIGLSLVQRLVELHGGTVEASSAGLGKGSRFTVRLPLQIELDNRITAAPDSRAATAPRLRRVLVVDDNRDAALSLAMVLEMKGNNARTAHDGIEALDVAAEFQPEVVLLDIGMPRLNGRDVARRIREQPWGKAMVLIALTGWSQEVDRDRSIAAGFDLHMTKPIDFEQLEQLLESLNPLSAGG